MHLQATDHVIGFKHGMAICLCVEGSTGIVCYDKKSIFCATCRYGASSCKHVNMTLDLLHEQPPPATLRHWVISAPHSASHPVHIPCKSTTSIPYQYTQSQQDILRQMMHVRLNIENGVAHLYPQSQTNCPIGEDERWSDPQLIKESVVVTDTATIPAKGSGILEIHAHIKHILFSVFSRKCTTKDCQGELQYDAQDQSCLLDFSSFFMVYEVLRRVLYHFVIGRCIIITLHSHSLSLYFLYFVNVIPIRHTHSF